ncbi:hypothetical protein DFH06DRAFT_1379940 [Mycena polygramma]|nr:hypothetical protein DFH06DRAFT_1379940 [Mycena polygramma]
MYPEHTELRKESVEGNTALTSSNLLQVARQRHEHPPVGAIGVDHGDRRLRGKWRGRDRADAETLAAAILRARVRGRVSPPPTMVTRWSAASATRVTGPWSTESLSEEESAMRLSWKPDAIRRRLGRRSQLRRPHKWGLMGTTPHAVTCSTRITLDTGARRAQEPVRLYAAVGSPPPRARAADRTVPLWPVQNGQREHGKARIDSRPRRIAAAATRLLLHHTSRTPRSPRSLGQWEPGTALCPRQAKSSPSCARSNDTKPGGLLVAAVSLSEIFDAAAVLAGGGGGGVTTTPTLPRTLYVATPHAQPGLGFAQTDRHGSACTMAACVPLVRSEELAWPAIYFVPSSLTGSQTTAREWSLNMFCIRKERVEDASDGRIEFGVENLAR